MSLNMLDYTYMRFATNFNVYDGDSVRCDLDEGDYRKEEQRPLRLYGVDTPELVPPWAHYGGDAGKGITACISERDKEKAAGRKARDRIKALLEAADGVVLVQTIKLPKRKVRDKYGRTLARIFIPIHEVWIDAAQVLLAEGHARPYDGGRKTKWAFLRELEKNDPLPLAVARALAVA